ncbi:Polysaccharide pyruvyl transferase family protein WcaK [Hyunsoonleella jejuensis]|uniref:Polysaccharide pyruvyl transferase family protein WcaK n=1 Tax=Hyunsoonleella jejuensis TaxID=419940 RepID=A0A1H9AZF6_9FLAO|nr:polysaccharide pyruvyl transferase family protein [Hyunsoonleella jejuensis]SEP82162.1 Polysaccharide pyruvyl transferase family protein WcaK [Hyunsoonleella jejuensis]
MKNRKVGIRGAYGEYNFGDDALMYFLYKWAKRNKINANFIGKEANYVSNFIPSKFYITKEKFHKYYFRSLIYGGGTQFFSFENTPRSGSKLKLLFRNPRLFIKKVQLAFEKKVISKQSNYDFLYSVGVGLGPFKEGSEIEKIAKDKISNMRGVFVRDKFSYNFTKPYNTNTFLSTDICFLPDIIDFKPFYNNSKKINKIGVILRDWSYSKEGAEYLDRVIEEASKLNSKYQVEFILFKDEVHCEMSIKNLGFNIIKWNPENHNLEDFISSLSSFDLFISSRFHGVIFGALLHIPSIAIEIEPKLKVTKEMLEDGVEIWKQPFTDDLEGIVTNIDYETAKLSLKVAVKKHNKLATDMFNNLLALIKTITS